MTPTEKQSKKMEEQISELYTWLADNTGHSDWNDKIRELHNLHFEISKRKKDLNNIKLVTVREPVKKFLYANV
ncbi:MAG: hypothetical protein ABIJ40_03575 [Bacteroidota bacterium]